MGLTNTQKIVLGLVFFIFLLLGWGMFPLFFKWLMVGIGSKETELKDFGSLGDIYGSLNTLFTSATLIIVLYSAYLQREANKDARDAMADQLQQAKDATNEQLQQAREATDKQLKLAQSTHDAQMKESRHAIFASTFNILLNQRKAILDSIYTGKEDLKPKKVFEKISDRFLFLIANEWRNLKLEDDKIEKKVSKELKNYMASNTDESFSYNELTSYIYMFVPILSLIKNSSLTEDSKSIYFDNLSCSMTHEEQVTLLWYAAHNEDIRSALKDTGLIDTWFAEKEMNFLVKNYQKSIFSNRSIIDNWKRISKKTPA